MAQRESIRWGVIGCGQIAVDKSVPGLLRAAGAKLVAVADPLQQRVELVRALARDQGVENLRSYADTQSLLRDSEIDAVYIALPTGMHAQAVAEAAHARKAILCEKPMGRTASEVKQMVRAAREAGVPLMTAYMSRFGDPFREAVRLIAENRIGQVTFISANFSYQALGCYPPGKPGGWRWTDPAGGGPLLDIGVYLAFGIREMLDDRIARVGVLQCNTVAPPEAAIHDTTVAWFQTRRGIPGSFTATFSHAECAMTFYGSKGRLDVQHIFSQSPTGKVICEAGDFRHVHESTITADRPHFDNYRREFEHFSQSLLKGTPFRPSPDEVLDDALLLDALNTPMPSNAGVVVPTAAEFLEIK